ncbi:hypothetical protein G6O69_19265 [Pseudenhygromyxa sp. WMMC2535]|uniref:hypothetical protein n=1 Tax=Pseudenhygromyxa sp. WMMC2535 TaxID=2712867 RepID=UPI001555D559|nr:hypothetical protein [Pseudenhygromyxa sp. WMMC2535]NVB39993.1 hypothetical protein [Pseudenhygromyxa sp. WMMC2535]
MAAPKRYDDEQVGLILKRAAELQAKSPGDSRRMSIEEVEAIAGEAGIDTALVRQAARELAQPKPREQSVNPLIGAASSLHFEARLTGEIPEDCFDELIFEINAALGEPGSISRSNRSLAWHSVVTQGQPGRRIAVTVTAARGETMIRIDERLQNLVGALFGGIVGGLGGGGMGLIALPIVFAPTLVPVFVLGWFGGAYALARMLYKRQVARREAELGALLDRMVGVCEGSIGGRAALEA